MSFVGHILFEGSSSLFIRTVVVYEKETERKKSYTKEWLETAYSDSNKVRLTTRLLWEFIYAFNATATAANNVGSSKKNVFKN